MKNRYKVLIAVAACIAALVAAVGVGSVSISPAAILQILGHQLFGLTLPETIDGITVSILWNVRLPRALLAFVVGAALAVSGTVMQSGLKNPLASSYTLGVSSGASLGAALVIIFGLTLPVAGMFTLPLAGTLCGLLTVFLVMAFAARLDRHVENQTIILVGMVLSLFVNAVLPLLSYRFREHMQRLITWQMGSFSGRDWSHLGVVFPIAVIGILLLAGFAKEMDIMTFGEEQAMTIGVELKRTKLILIGLSALLTGASVAFAGVIGFIDLIAPHVVRRIFGSSHKLVVPMSALFGGAFMALADLLARTLTAPSELPVGAVTALVGAPFFAYVYFKKRKRV